MLIFKKEKRVVSLISEHADRTAECVSEWTAALKAYVDGSDDDLSKKITDLESEADARLREIRELLFSGAYLPTVRADIYRLMAAVDRIANAAEEASFFFFLERPDIPDEFAPAFRAMIEGSGESFKALEKALRGYVKPGGKIDKIREHVRSVSELESSVDEMETSLVRQVFASELELARKLHLRDCIRHIAGVADRCEDAADELMLTSLKSIG
jgi:predicted phosphate transport protein (TIGR00153 family)